MDIGPANQDAWAGERLARPPERARHYREEVLPPSLSSGTVAGAIALRRPVPGPAPAVGTYDRQQSLAARALKRAFDLAGALLLLLLLSPAWATIALLIWVDSPGSIFFRQRRIGRDGKAFWMLKFRTMVDGAEARRSSLLHLNEAGEGLFKIPADPRITRIGRWMRASCLDELPQLLHVVSGQMSLVGPRPLVPEEDEWIRGRDRCRLSVRPGMTGVWQLSGAWRVPIDEMAALDRGYVERWSPWVDLKLLAGTARFVIQRRGL
jgi:lipopolysaccharide/colanic/teichoic acid biosynthesis glycosyltransferase